MKTLAKCKFIFVFTIIFVSVAISTSFAMNDTKVNEEAEIKNEQAIDEEKEVIVDEDNQEETVEEKEANNEKKEGKIRSEVKVEPKQIEKGSVENKNKNSDASIMASVRAQNENWSQWTSGQHTINFMLNNKNTIATVSMPGNPPVPSGYGTNANQFGVILDIEGVRHTYTFFDGSSESSGVFIGAGDYGNDSPFVIRPNNPIVNGGAQVNVNELKTDYEFFYLDNKVKEVSIITLPQGEKVLFTQIVEFRNSGVYHKSSFINVGDKPITDFRIINKVDAFLEDDYVPVYFGENRDTYYLKAPSGLRLRVSGLDGVTGSVAANHQRIWDPGFTNTYRNYNQSTMEAPRTPGALALSNTDTEIVFDQRPSTLGVGETAVSTFVVNYLMGEAVNVNYLDENGVQIEDSELLSGPIGEDYRAERKAINGYTLDMSKLPTNEFGKFQSAPQEVNYIYTKNPIEKFIITYDGNKNDTGNVPVDNKEYLVGEKADISDGKTLFKINHKFVGWNTKADGKGKKVIPGAQKWEMEENVTFYAMWESIATPPVDPEPRNTDKGSPRKIIKTDHVDKLLLPSLVGFSITAIYLGIRRLKKEK